jgi:hypothetical protein
VKETHSFPRLSLDEYKFMHEFLNRAESRRALAKISGIKEKEFVVTEVRGVRGTFLFCINVVGTDSNKVDCLASNAAQRIMAFYATNQPSWQLTYVDSGCFTPRTLLERMKDFFGL